jgi:hypothetical protein
MINWCTIRCSYRRTYLSLKDLYVLDGNICTCYKHKQAIRMRPLQMLRFPQFHYTFQLAFSTLNNKNTLACHYLHSKIDRINSLHFLSTIKSILSTFLPIPKLQPTRNLILKYLQLNNSGCLVPVP